MSRGSIGKVAGVVLLTALVPAAFAAQSKSDDPVAVYKEYLGVLAKASSLDPLLPYFTKELADGMRTMPKEMHGNYLKMNKRVVPVGRGSQKFKRCQAPLPLIRN